MKGGIKRGRHNSRRLHIDRRMIGILSVFAVLGICLVISIVIATNTLSGLRGLASLQTHWTEVRKEATVQLTNYLQTGEKKYYTRFDSALSVIDAASDIRYELLSENPDYQVARNNLLALHSIPEDVDNIITSFEYFHDFSDFRIALNQWVKSDSLVEQIEKIAVNYRQQVEDSRLTANSRSEFISTLFNLDRKLTLAQYDLAAALSSGTRFLNNVTLWVSSSLGFIILVTGGFLAFRFLRSVKNWQRTLEISEQRYRSLFDQNPNGVYSISKDGKIINSNEALITMTGYALDDFNDEYFSNFVDPSELENMNQHFQKALEGIPQTYETSAVRKNGDILYMHVTNLPIYVDGKIIGVYGIAQDITERREAEKEIKKQLEEKTHLLAEVHDRVKNNLALISSLIQLKQENSVSDEEVASLQSTLSRIHSMAMVHEHLYHTETFSNIRFDDFVTELSKSMQISYDNISLNLDVDPVILNLKQAVPAALLLNELLTNACKYSTINNKQGKVEAALLHEDSQVIISVKDNGPGLPEDINLDESETLGMRLIKVLIKQLDASYLLNKNAGTSFEIRFKNEKKSGSSRYKAS